MTQQITLIKDKILSDNYFTLHNITYDLTRKDGEVIRHKREVTIAVMVQRSSCTTRRKRPWF
ncbi:NUDIX-family hydrolase [Escherichia coli]|uniref:NUDIX-family hydrolase n=1 Tax=Escherichia coli TaxID=562 RepID=A0A376SA92_ECOLX|nr:NUDIX-family hydrolase [Escherichia coli]